MCLCISVYVLFFTKVADAKHIDSVSAYKLHSFLSRHILFTTPISPLGMQIEVKLNLRKRQGPGRYTGRKVLVIGKVRLVITLYELDSDTNR